ncbi:MAG: hypothetical protein KF878_31750 [Planctomycetes bacterium]|nr:hypothetical protein [Planctomycetota bacterium]
MRRRGHTLAELVAATTLLVVLLATHTPPPAPTQALLEAVEAEAARLLVEGELTLVRQEAARGALPAGAWRRDAGRWSSAARLRGLELLATVAPADGGLLEVAVEARWRSEARLDARPRALRLGALVPAGRAP